MAGTDFTFPLGMKLFTEFSAGTSHIVGTKSVVLYIFVFSGQAKEAPGVYRDV